MKIGRFANEGGSRNSLTDQKKLPTFPKNISLSPFNDQLAHFREPPPPFSSQNLLTDHKKKLLTFPY